MAPCLLQMSKFLSVFRPANVKMAPKRADITEEVSKPDLISAFDSQITDSSHLLSLPSEPPDIRNWFSSYEYESPATLGLERDCKGLLASDDETDGEKEMILERTENPKDPCNDDCAERPFDESTEGEKFLVCSEQECHLQKKIDDSSHLLSLPSEPPDIRNWFSSYNYESPAILGLESDCKGLLTSEEETDREKEEILERTENPKDPNDDDCVERSLNEFTKDERFPEYSEQECHLEKKDLLSDEINETSPNSKSFLSRGIGKDDYFQGQALLNSHYIPLTDKVNSNVDDEIYPESETFNGKYFRKGDPLLSEVDENICEGHDKSTEKLVSSMQSKEEESEGKDLRKLASPKSNIYSTGLNGNSVEKSLSASNGKEGKCFASNGFISTKRNKATKSNTRNFPKELNLRKDEVSENGEKWSDKAVGLMLQEKKRKEWVCGGGDDGRAGRMALSDRTNLHMGSNPEVSGKWRCPQKSKPFVGPPLKQLHLERWVRRVQ